MLRTIILDFDGVIVESVSVKTDAFRKLFSFAPRFVPAIVEFHEKNGGMSRYDKFRYIYDSLLKIPLSDQQMRNLSDSFSKIVIDNVISAPLVAGTEQFLSKYQGKIPLYVVSATPQDELEYIITKKGLIAYFRGVYGSPAKKEEHFKNILEAEGIMSSSALYIGDSLNDWNAARTAGIPFIARVTTGTVQDFAGRPAVESRIYTMFDLIAYLEQQP